ncbi:MAG: aspartate/glutamate racemase family protein [Methanomicrobia archaeon]|nr:aspartate/glutamate racemase family protein [Methanomicrobia archaeon]MCK4433648.1 aspartate/glutamate racemase family protein [Methanomicrobia archaeon]
MKDKTLGIIGGMGPEATIYFFKKITKATCVEKDQDHIHIIIDSNPQIPDRTKHILGEGPSPLPKLLESLRLLESFGADLIVIPCNTAHYFIDDLRKEAKIEIISILETTRAHIKEKYPEVKNIGLLASSGTVESKIYQKIFEDTQYTILTPEKEEQKKLMENIYNEIKKGKIKEARSFLRDLCGRMSNRGSEMVIAGCTEIPLALESVRLDVPLIDPMEITAKHIVRRIKSTSTNKNIQ